MLAEKHSDEFRKLHLRLDEDTHPKIKSLALWTERWLKAASTNETPIKTRWTLLSGPAGTGKTHCLRAANRFFRKYSGKLWPRYHRHGPPGVKWVNWSTAVAHDKFGWEDFLEEIRNAKIILVDDIGSEVDRYKSGEPAERLRMFLNQCEGRWMLATTNVARKSFLEVFDARIYSRLELAACLDLTGAPDYRPKVTQ
jgi:chromosomal replication initiation ATPase DnaA